jgi:hypothetical protein
MKAKTIGAQSALAEICSEQDEEMQKAVLTQLVKEHGGLVQWKTVYLDVDDVIAIREYASNGRLSTEALVNVLDAAGKLLDLDSAFLQGQLRQKISEWERQQALKVVFCACQAAGFQGQD